MFIEEQPVEALAAEALPARAAELKAQGYRLVQVCCTSEAQEFEVTYSFDKGYKFLNLRVRLPREGASVPSITGSYLAAFTYENEMQDLFGVRVPGLAVDYKGNFYRTKVKTPMAEPYASAAKPAPAPAPAAPNSTSGN